MANLISNGDFETDTASSAEQVPGGWTKTEGTPDQQSDGGYEWAGSWMPDDLDAAGGSGYATLFGSKTQDEGLTTELTAPVQAGETYRLSFDCFVNDSDGTVNTPGATNLIVTLGSQKITIPIDSTGATAPYWQEVTLTFTASETTTQFTIATDSDPGAHEMTGIALDNMVLDTARDFIVSGSSGADTIDAGYHGDPEGDRIDAQDHSDGSQDDLVEAGAGDDHVAAGFGNDTIRGEAGDDRLAGGAGNDLIRGGQGQDVLHGDAGDDTLYGGTESDSLQAGDGDDSLHGGDADDLMLGEAGRDSLDGGSGNDLMSGGSEDDSLYGNTGNDTMHGGSGDDYLRGSYGEDELHGGTGDDYLWSGYNDDTITIEDDFGNDTIDGDAFDETHGDTLDLTAVSTGLTLDLTDANPETGSFSDGTSTAGFIEIENILLGGGNDTLTLADFGGADSVQGFAAPTVNTDGTLSPNDRLDVSQLTSDGTTPVTVADVGVSDDGAGNAQLSFPGGESLTLVGIAPEQAEEPAFLVAIGIPTNLVVDGSAAGDLMGVSYADGEGDRTDGSDGLDDTIAGHGGSDTIDGGLGDDRIEGGADGDLIDGGSGADVILGGDGADTIEAGRGDVVDGGFGGLDQDTLMVTGPAVIAYDADDPESGTVTYLVDGATMRFSEIETVEYVPCFTPGSLIMTSTGEVPVEQLRVGDRVLTRDHGCQAIRWIGRREVEAGLLAKRPELRPIRIARGALGEGRPERDMQVSPQHRVLVGGAATQVWFGEDEVLVPATHLTCLEGVEVTPAETPVTYIHILFDRHEVVLSDGLWSESFQPGDLTLTALDDDQRAELLALFPELAGQRDLHRFYPAARATLRGPQVRVLFRR